MKPYTERCFLVSCEFEDCAAMAVLMEGCKAHADVESFPVWLTDLNLEKYIGNDKMVGLGRFLHLSQFEETWFAIFPTLESLECFTEILATINFHKADYVRFLDFNSMPGTDIILNLPQFHKHVFHES